ncbi:MAG: alpha/beta hydrolase [Saprospiraceae bacterium]|nr:alpha/beta hydrolase [Saprospiraceae bacterium]MCF8249090.1 alpha/beta hydrolase [Saprospiraceae bacterium]MCF8280957.1 alpha/beta hydrolase [Bacteroidales bacterium]MCF8311112.1 alpha/beta hydrolase [Saprospiraceae bacterium]MCF8440202.1 alpha/beta hydrolase [Saprospiraceae bacterium]
MQQITFQGKQIAFFDNNQENGRDAEGLPVIFLHGFLEDSRLWDEWLPLLPARRYICIDLPGAGSSELIENLTMESMAGAVAAVVEHLGIEKFVLMGHSMGGYVSIAFAEKWGEKLAGLCLFHSHPFEDSEEKKASRLKSVEFIHKNGHVIYVRQAIPQLFIYDYSKGYQSEVNRLIHNAVYFKPENIIATLDAMRLRRDRSEVLRNIDCPVLLLIGKHDTAVPLELSMAMTPLPKQASIHVFPTVGHMGMFSASRETAKVFREFLAEI